MKQILVFIFVSTIFITCEYRLERENIVEITQSDQNVVFDIDLLNEKDTINVFGRKEFKYSLNIQNRRLLKGHFTVSGQSWEIYNTDGNFIIDPSKFSPGYHKLSLEFYTNSATGSVADGFNIEGYKVKRDWVLTIDNRRAPVTTMRHSITEDGYLKVSWDKCKNLNFKSYSLYSDSNAHEIHNIDSLYFIDSCYIGGERSWVVNTRIKEGTMSYGKWLEVDDPIPTIKTTNIGVDSLKISWNRSKYNCKYRLTRTDTHPDTLLLVSETDTSITLPHPGIGRHSTYKLITSPIVGCDKMSSYVKSNSKHNTLGEYIANNWPNYAYNSTEKVVYTNTFSKMECYKVKSVEKINSRRVKNLTSCGLYSCPTNSSKTATMTGDSIFVFENKELSSPLIIPYDSFLADYLYLTDNNLIAIAHSNRYDIVSLEEKKVVKSLTIEDYPIYSRWACITTSKDGRYMCVVTNNGLKLYSLINQNIELVHQDNRKYRSAYFDITNPSKLILSLATKKLEVRSVPDFSLIKELDFLGTGVVIENMDPETGYMLVTNYEYMYVIDISENKLIFKIKCHMENKSRLYNGRLFTNYGYTLDISKYLNK